MALTESRRAANDKYLAAHYKRLPISYPNEFCDEVRIAAEAAGESLAGYIRKAIEMRMEADAQNEESPE